MKFKSSPLGISLGAGVAIAALALVVQGGGVPENSVPGGHADRAGVAAPGFSLGFARAEARPDGQPQRLPVSGLSIRTAAGKQFNFSVEVARTPEELATGLMYRRELAEDAGMLFLFRRPQRASFWMLNTYIPLDLIFIGTDGRIESIQANAKPMTMDPIQSKGPVIAVLEIGGGLAARHGLAPGDRVLHAELPKEGTSSQRRGGAGFFWKPHS